MKKIVLLIAFFVIQFAFAQNNKIQTVPTKNEADNNLYNSAGVEVKPEFPGGIQEFYNYITRNFHSPTSKQFKGGKLFVQFIIDKDGSVTDIKVLKDLGFGTKEEAVRILTDCIKWKPAWQNGEPVRCSYTLPINLPSN
jgi:periplasmic protein TonB